MEILPTQEEVGCRNRFLMVMMDGEVSLFCSTSVTKPNQKEPGGIGG